MPQSFASCLYSDQVRLNKLNKQLDRLRDPEERGRLESKIETLRSESEHTLNARLQQQLNLSFPEDLPVSGKSEEIAKALTENQVVIVAGETGSGKTTQLPKICLQAGFGFKGMIGHTQPRRLAARTVSSRIASEMQVELGEAVGYQVRFTDQVSRNTLIKVMTDGILLSEIKQDPILNRYEVLIIDEAHERSLNIDFLLGYIKQILPKRPELKVLITSATIDVERFSGYFSEAPVLEVEGRSFPVDVFYRPPVYDSDDDSSLARQISDVMEEIQSEERARGWRAGDVLVFLPGEREIRDTAKYLRHAEWRDTEILPLYARLSAQEQNRVFRSHAGRRIVLATNVAETSITVPGIRYVIDPGTVRMSRYSYRSKIQRLPIEAVSQASANQRKGRCGRVAEGICYRLYSEEDFQNRPQYTDPEILRTNLAAVILKMLDSGIGKVRHFPFIDVPEKKLWNDGYKLLFELGAVTRQEKLTPLGKQMARIPADPRLSRILLASVDEGCVDEALVIVSALSVQDPRERPAEKRQAADQAHALFRDADSDFVAWLNLWKEVEKQRQELSASQFKKFCQKHFLSYMRLREWRELHRQYHLTLKPLLKLKQTTEADYDAVHRSLLHGFLGQIGHHDEKRDYQGCRNRKFQIFPGSAIAKRQCKWLVAAEIVETQQVYARHCARIDPSWIEPMAQHLVKKSWSEPHWEKKRAQVCAYEKVSLYGLEIVARRKVNFANIDPLVSREIFIRSGLVEGEYQGRVKVIEENRALAESLEAIEDRTRKRDIVVDDEQIFQLYDQQLPEHVVSGASFEKWYRKLDADAQAGLKFSRSDLMRSAAPEFDPQAFPDYLENNGIKFPLSYQFNPGDQKDGVTVSVPLHAARQLSAERLELLVPGLLREKCIQLIKTLPRTLRKHLVPAPDTVDEILPAIESSQSPLLETMSQQIKIRRNVDVPVDAWDPAQLEDHLRINVEILDAEGKVLKQGRQVVEMVDELSAEIDQSAARLTEQEVETIQLHDWSFDVLEDEVETTQAGISMRMFPALKDCGSYVEKILCADTLQAEKLSRLGTARLLIFRLASQLESIEKQLPDYKKMALLYAPVGQARSLYDDFKLAVVANHFLAGGAVRSQAAFEELLVSKRGDFFEFAVDFSKLVADILQAYHELQKSLKGKVSLEMAMPLSDLKNQLSHLVFDGFIATTDYEHLIDLPRFLSAARLRFEKMSRNMAQERQVVPVLQAWWQQYSERKKTHDAQGIFDPELEHFRWMIEEQRVSWFAQTLGTRETVSEKRLNRQWDKVRRS